MKPAAPPLRDNNFPKILLREHEEKHETSKVSRVSVPPCLREIYLRIRSTFSGEGRFFSRVLLSTAALFFAFSCSQAKPEIKFGSLQLVWYENGGTPVERLSFFVLPSDDDGLEDLEELWLFHEWESLSWQTASEDWIRETINGQLWIGSRNIAMADGSPMPRGQYLAVLVDKGGDRTERYLTFDAPSRENFPSFSISQNRYTIVSDFPQQNFIVYNNEGVYLMTIPAPSKEGEISSLGLPSQASSMALWAFDSEQSFSALTDVAPLND